MAAGIDTNPVDPELVETNMNASVIDTDNLWCQLCSHRAKLISHKICSGIILKDDSMKTGHRIDGYMKPELIDSGQKSHGNTGVMTNEKMASDCRATF